MAGATGLEPAGVQTANLLVAHGFRRNELTARRLPPSIESSRVSPRPLKSTPVVERFWRVPACFYVTSPRGSGPQPLAGAQSFMDACVPQRARLP